MKLIQPIKLEDLPLTILEELIRSLSSREKVKLISLNRRFRSVATQIVYKDIIYRANVGVEVPIDEILYFRDYLIGNNVFRITSIKIAETVNYFKQRQESEMKRLIWRSLQPTVQKYTLMIKNIKTIDPDNFVSEIESYTGLLRCRIELLTIQQIEHLIEYKERLNTLNKLELVISMRNSNSAELMDLSPIRQVLLTNIENFQNYWVTKLCNAPLVYLCIDTWDINITFFLAIHKSFPHLKKLELNVLNLKLNNTVQNFPTFSTVLSLRFTGLEHINLYLLNLLTDGAHWPNLKYLSVQVRSAPILLTGNWDNLTTLVCNGLNYPQADRDATFRRLRRLHLQVCQNFFSTALSRLLQNLTHLNVLCIDSSTRSEIFDHLQHLRLYQLILYSMFDFTLPLIHFLLLNQTQLRAITINFVQDAFEEVEANKLLMNYRPAFSQLSSIKLFRPPTQLENWFRSSATNLKKVEIGDGNGTIIRYL